LKNFQFFFGAGVAIRELAACAVRRLKRFLSSEFAPERRKRVSARQPRKEEPQEASSCGWRHGVKREGTNQGELEEIIMEVKVFCSIRPPTVNGSHHVRQQSQVK
jgi:hypothetical protein